jgi:dTDP-4-amino-4,6-dideoxygalactose transaminase
MQVPALDLKAQYAGLRAEIEPVLLQLCAAQTFVLGPEVETLEKEVAAYLRAPYAVGCASGTDALILALRALGVGPGDEVVTTPFTFFATAGAIALAGATPVFSDIDPVSFNLDPALLPRALTPRTRAIIAVDLFGQCAEMSPILETAAKHGLPVVQDAAQSIGAEHRGRRTGELTLTTLSFYPSKNLGGFGDGGMLVTPDEAQARRLRQLRVHGEASRYVHEHVGTNSRLDALQAAVLRVKLRYLDRWVDSRQRLAASYTESFTRLGLLEAVQVPRIGASSTRHVFNQYTVRARERDRLRQHLADRGIGTMIYYPVPLHLQPCFASLGYRPGDLPVAERAAEEVLSLPIYPELTVAQQELVVHEVATFYSGR